MGVGLVCETQSEKVTETGQVELTCELDPGLFRALDKQVRPMQGQVEVLNMTVQRDADTLLKKPSTTAAAAVAGNETPARRAEASGGDSHSGMSSGSVGIGVQRGKALPGPGGKVSKLTCNGCGAVFATPKEHREHFRTDWHRMNQKRKAAGLPPLTEEECLAEALHESSLNDMDQFS